MTDNEIKLLEATRNLMKKLYGENCKCEVRSSYTSTGEIVVFLRANGKKAVELNFLGKKSDFSLMNRMFGEISGKDYLDLDEVLFPYDISLRYKNTRVKYDLADMYGLKLVPDDNNIILSDYLPFVDNGLLWRACIYYVKIVGKPKTLFMSAI